MTVSVQLLCGSHCVDRATSVNAAMIKTVRMARSAVPPAATTSAWSLSCLVSNSFQGLKFRETLGCIARLEMMFEKSIVTFYNCHRNVRDYTSKFRKMLRFSLTILLVKKLA